MARPLRIEFDGAFYHILQRGMEKRKIFSSDKDKKQFLLYLTFAHRSYGAVFHGYVLMNNHFHLILETPKGNLTKVMHFINTSYAVYYNTKYKRVGSLFQGRYKAILVEAEEYLHRLSGYIHLNPVRAKIITRSEEYEWSSYAYYIKDKVPQEGIEIKFILGMFGKKQKRAKKLYKDFMENMLTHEDNSIEENTLKGIVIGSTEFFNAIKEKYIDKREDYEIPKLSEIKQIDDEKKKDIIDKVVDDIIKNKKQGRKLKIYFVRKNTQFTLKDIAQRYGGMKYSGISHIRRRIDVERRNNKDLERMVEEIDKMVKCQM